MLRNNVKFWALVLGSVSANMSRRLFSIAPLPVPSTSICVRLRRIPMWSQAFFNLHRESRTAPTCGRFTLYAVHELAGGSGHPPSF